jgi:hypothetical protein
VFPSINSEKEWNMATDEKEKCRARRQFGE